MPFLLFLPLKAHEYMGYRVQSHRIGVCSFSWSMLHLEINGLEKNIDLVQSLASQIIP